MTSREFIIVWNMSPEAQVLDSANSNWELATRKISRRGDCRSRRSVDEETVDKEVSWRGGAEATCCKENRRTKSLPITNFSLTAPFNSPEQVNAIFLYCPKPKRRNRIHAFIDFTLVDWHKKDRSDAQYYYRSHFQYVGFNVFHYKIVFCVHLTL